MANLDNAIARTRAAQPRWRRSATKGAASIAAATLPLEPEVVVDDGETHAELIYRAAGVVGPSDPGTGRS